MLDFPNSPTTGQTFSSPGGTTWTYDGAKWGNGTLLTIPDAPSDANTYGRHAGSWNAVLTGITSAQVTGALGFTPYNATNPAGYQTSAQVTAALPVASSTVPLMDSTAAIGTGTTWARADHVHASDTSRAAAANAPAPGVNGSVLQSNGTAAAYSRDLTSLNSVNINQNAAAPPAPPSTEGLAPLHIAGPDAQATGLLLDAWYPYGANLTFRQARGTAAVQSATQSGDFLANLQAYGRGATAYGTNSGTQMVSVASENWTDTAQGAHYVFANNEPGTASLAIHMMIYRGVVIGYSTTDPGVNNLAILGTLAVGTTGAGGGVLASFTAPTTQDNYLAIIGARNWRLGAQYTGGSLGRLMLLDDTVGATRIMVDSAGACFNTTGTWAALSDRRLKQDITPYERGIAAVRQLNPVAFRFTQRSPMGGDSDALRYGLIADEVLPVIPELVGTTEILLAPDDVEPTTVSTLEPGNLIYAVINACKELAAQNAALEARIAALEGARH